MTAAPPINQTDIMPRDVAAQTAVGAIGGALSTVRKMRRGAAGMEDVYYETTVAGLEATRDYAQKHLLEGKPT